MADRWNIPYKMGWTKIENISNLVSKGTTPTTSRSSFTNKGVAFIRAEDVIGGPINPHTVKYFVDEKTNNTILRRSRLQSGDFLITIAGSLGRVGYIPLNAPDELQPSSCFCSIEA